MINLDEYNKLKHLIDNLKAKAERSKGALEQKMKELQKKFDCSSIEEAVELLGSLKKDVHRAELAYINSLNDFKAKWGSKLEEL